MSVILQILGLFFVADIVIGTLFAIYWFIRIVILDRD
jgi:hypothetical protein